MSCLHLCFLISLDSQAVIADKTMYVSGQLGLDPEVIYITEIVSFHFFIKNARQRNTSFQKHSEGHSHLVGWDREGVGRRQGGGTGRGSQAGEGKTSGSWCLGHSGTLPGSVLHGFFQS